MPFKNLIMAVGDTGTFTDEKDGKVYSWKILKDGKMWMTQNYNFKSITSICYDNKEANAAKYGRMYTRNDAVNNAPNGWRLPGTMEWQDLPYSAKQLPTTGDSGLNVIFGGGSYKKEDGNISFFGIEERHELGSYWTFSEGEQNGGHPSSFDYKLTRDKLRSGYLYGIQGAFLTWDNFCYVRYIKDIK